MGLYLQPRLPDGISTASLGCSGPGMEAWCWGSPQLLGHLGSPGVPLPHPLPLGPSVLGNPSAWPLKAEPWP